MSSNLPVRLDHLRDYCTTSVSDVPPGTLCYVGWRDRETLEDIYRLCRLVKFTPNHLSCTVQLEDTGEIQSGIDCQVVRAVLAA